MGNPKDLKLFSVYALEEIFSKISYDENIFYIIIAYLTKFRDDYSIYMEVDENNLNFDSTAWIKWHLEAVNSAIKQAISSLKR